MGYTDHAQCLTQRAFHRLRAALMRQFGMKRSQIKPETRLVELFPRKDRRRQIKQILDDIGIPKPINLYAPDWVHASILTVCFAGGATIAIFLAWKPVSSPDLLINLIFASPIATAIGGMILFLPLALLLTKGTRGEFGKTMQTVGDLSRWLVGAAPDLATASPGQWNREQISAISDRQTHP